jgi:hypothetical protein
VAKMDGDLKLFFNICIIYDENKDMYVVYQDFLFVDEFYTKKEAYGCALGVIKKKINSL